MIVRVTGIGSSIAISEQTIGPEGVVIRSGLPFDYWNRRDAQRKSADAGLENTLRRLQRDALAIQIEAAHEDSPIQKVGGKPPLLVKKRKRGESNPEVGFIHPADCTEFACRG